MKSLFAWAKRRPRRVLAIVALSIACVQVGPQYLPPLIGQLEAAAAEA